MLIINYLKRIEVLVKISIQRITHHTNAFIICVFVISYLDFVIVESLSHIIQIFMKNSIDKLEYKN